MFLMPIMFLMYYFVEVDVTSLFSKLLIFFLLDHYVAAEHIECFYL